ncbi:hypothetical protein [Oscillibacter sp.]|nr:hypothetical protein [Oscillibacter sp.]
MFLRYGIPAADAAGESLNDFICKAIDERMERMEGGSGAIRRY